MAVDKSQWVRLLDAFVLGPFMIWYALTTTPAASSSDNVLPHGAAIALFIAGVLTIVYNGSNWMRNSNWLW
jgi:hypothetical protein